MGSAGNESPHGAANEIHGSRLSEHERNVRQGRCGSASVVGSIDLLLMVQIGPPAPC